MQVRPSFAAQDEAQPFTALWDTAATTSAISDEVVQALGLVAHPTPRHVTGITGNAHLPEYAVEIVLPMVAADGRLVAERVNVTETARLPNLYQVDDYVDVLIGMDIISLGDLVLSHAKGRTEFRFRMPAEGVGWD